MNSLPIYRRRRPYAKSYCRKCLERLDQRCYPAINCKHFHLHSKHSMPKDIHLNTPNPRNQYFWPDYDLVDLAAEKNFLKIFYLFTKILNFVLQ